MSISIGQKVKHADGAVASAAANNPHGLAAPPLNQAHTGTVVALNPGRQYLVNGKTVSVDLCDVTWDNTPLKNSQAQSALIGA